MRGEDVLSIVISCDPSLAGVVKEKSRDMDVALEQGRSSNDPEVRAKNYLRFGELLQEEAPAVILYTSPYMYMVSKKVRGIDLQSMTTPADRFNGAAQWFMRSRPGWK